MVAQQRYDDANVKKDLEALLYSTSTRRLQYLDSWQKKIQDQFYNEWWEKAKLELRLFGKNSYIRKLVDEGKITQAQVLE